MAAPTIDFDPARHRYKVNGESVPSVTRILGKMFDKSGPMAWWGQGVGVEGVVRLRSDGIDVPWEDPQAIVKLLTTHKLTTNHTRDRAGDRGSAAHAAAERWAKEGIVPNPADYPVEQRGYVRSLALWLTEERPEYLATEVVVGSAEHRYAGTYDARVRIGNRTGIVDYKTSKRIYLSQFFQLAAYELAACECGAEPSDFQAVVRLSPDGAYEFERSRVTAEQWLTQLAAHRDQEAAKGAQKAAA